MGDLPDDRTAQGPLYEGRRRWVAHTFAIATVALTGTLGLWQWRRANDKAAAQAARARAFAGPAVELSAALLQRRLDDLQNVTMLDGARARVRGRFDGNHTIFLDNRTHAGVAGFHVLAPLRVDGADRVVMVLRGWIAGNPRDRTQVPALTTPAQVVDVEGLAERELKQPILLDRANAQVGTARIWQHYDPGTFAAWAGREPYPLILRQTVEPAYADALARDWNQPGTTVDRHRAYALQWFTMAAGALLAWGWLARRRAPATAEEARPALARVPTPRAGRRHGKLYLLIAICIAPVVASYLAYYVLPPSGRTNYGALLEPQIALSQLDTHDSLRRFQGRWILVAIQAGPCDEACARQLYFVRQTHASLGKDRDRVAMVLLQPTQQLPRLGASPTTSEPLAPALAAAHPSLTVISIDADFAARAFPAGSQGEAGSHLYVVDPLQHVMMRFPVNPDPARTRKDLKRLLKASRIG